MQAFLRILTTAYIVIAGLPVYVSAGLLAAVAILILRVPYLSAAAAYPYKLAAMLFSLGRGRQTWSVVYDSHTKLPLDPVYITVRNPVGVEVASMITDINGRFSLILQPGIYTLYVQKTNYAYPSYELRGIATDGAYENLYYGKKLEIVGIEQAVTVSIPMDPIGADWNEEEKKRMKIAPHFRKEEHIAGATYAYLILGSALTFFHYAMYRDEITLGLFKGYVVAALILLAVYLFRPTQYSHSVVLDKTGTPLQFAKVTIYSAVTRNKLTTKTTSYLGQFTALLPKGDYYLTIEARDAAGSYSLVYTSPIMRLAQGYLGRKFSV